MPSSLTSEALEFAPESACNSVGQNISRAGSQAAWTLGVAGLYGPNGERKYLDRDERDRALAAMETLDSQRSLFALVLAWTGARVSEVLALTAGSFQIERSIVTIATLKRRRASFRQVPIPPKLMARLEQHFELKGAQERGETTARLWPWCRVTAWRLIKKVMAVARVTGCCACPRGLRHGYGVGNLMCLVPIHLIQRWMGHARLSSTMIYMAVCGPEEITFARRFWRPSPLSQEAHAAQAA